jgi:DNA ligase-1
MYRACTLTPGIPVALMLAKPTKSIQEVLKQLHGLMFTREFKYNGERAQVHMQSDGTTSVISQSLVESRVKSFVFDTEVVAFSRETGPFVPFFSKVR